MKSLNDNKSVRPSGLTGTDGENGKGRSGVVGNERLTALAGAVLLVLILVEIVSAAYLHALLPIHIFVGVLLAGPLVVKLGSTGYRFLRYYTKSPAYVRSGPPRLPLAGVVAALLLFPGAAPWVLLNQTGQKISGALIGGLALAIVVLLVARPLRWR
jgi:hypothetical protein